MNYCSNCGSQISKGIPEHEDRERYYCKKCGVIHYQNPRMVVGCIPEWQDKILLCLRDIEPRRNRWTLPAGYLENGESALEGAKRETREETMAEVIDLEPYYLADLIGVNQLYMMFRCRLSEPNFQKTRESKDVRLFTEEEIPWDSIAFNVITKTLKRYFADRQKGNYVFRNEILHTPQKHSWI